MPPRSQRARTTPYTRTAGAKDKIPAARRSRRLPTVQGGIHLRAARCTARHPCCHPPWAHCCPPGASTTPHCQLGSGCTGVVLFADAIRLPSWSKCGPGPVSCLQHCWRWRGSTPRWTWCVCRAALRCSSTLRCSGPPPTRTGWPCGLCEERQCGRCSGCAQRRLLALTRTLTVVLVTWDAGMVRRARQVASGRFCSERSARSLFVLRNPQLISEKNSNFEVV